MKVLTIVLLFAATAFQPTQPQLSLKDVQGRTHSLSEYKGKIVVLNFWATWCIPCKQEMPIFVDVSRKYRDRGVVVVAASLDDDTTRKYIPQFARSFKMDFPILVDANSGNMHELGLGESIPSTVFLDAEGNVVGKIEGQAKKKDVSRQLEALLGKQDSQR
jgi:thiol-disulfide isomerase/thioredoxin